MSHPALLIGFPVKNTVDQYCNAAHYLLTYCYYYYLADIMETFGPSRSCGRVHSVTGSVCVPEPDGPRWTAGGR